MRRDGSSWTWSGGRLTAQSDPNTGASPKVFRNLRTSAAVSNQTAAGALSAVCHHDPDGRWTGDQTASSLAGAPALAGRRRGHRLPRARRPARSIASAAPSRSSASSQFFAWLLVIGLTLYGLAVFVALGPAQPLLDRRPAALPQLPPDRRAAVLPDDHPAADDRLHVRGRDDAGRACARERQATLGQMESWTLEYTITGRKPAGALPTLEIYDTDEATGRAAAGVAAHEELQRRGRPRTASRCSSPRGSSKAIRRARSCSCSRWTSTGPTSSYERWRMIVAHDERQRRAQRRTAATRTSTSTTTSFKDVFGDEHRHATSSGATSPSSPTGQTGTQLDRSQPVHADRQPAEQPLLVLLRRVGGRYFDILATIIAGLAALLMAMYFVAALFAAVLIFSHLARREPHRERHARRRARRLLVPHQDEARTTSSARWRSRSTA